MTTSTVERQAANAQLGTPYARTTVIAPERIALPAAMLDGFCVFAAEKTDVYVRFGDGAVGVAIGARSVIDANGVITDPGATVRHLHIPAGSSVHFQVPAGATHMAHVSADANGVFGFGHATGE